MARKTLVLDRMEQGELDRAYHVMTDALDELDREWVSGVRMDDETAEYLAGKLDEYGLSLDYNEIMASQLDVLREIVDRIDAEEQEQINAYWRDVL